MTTEVQIDWREWRDWQAGGEALRLLNKLLNPHGVHIDTVNPPGCDFVDLRAMSTTTDWGEEWRNNPSRKTEWDEHGNYTGTPAPIPKDAAAAMSTGLAKSEKVSAMLDSLDGNAAAGDSIGVGGS